MVVRIRATNFMSWKSLTFDIDKGITLIDGWNEDDQTSEGSGKSAVFNALSWGLYGKIPKDVNIDDVIKHKEKSCNVSIFLEGFIVCRSRKPNDLYLIELNKRTREGTKVKGKDIRETQKLIEDRVGLSFDAFCQATYFAQNSDKKFISSNQEDRGKILSEIQDLQVFDVARKDVTALAKVENANLIKLKHSIDVTKKDLIIVESNMSLEEQRIQHIKDSHQKSIDSVKSQVQIFEVQYKNIQGTIIELERQLINIIIDSKEKQLLVKDQDQLTLIVNKLMDKKSNIDTLLQERQRKQSEGERYGSKYNELTEKFNKINEFVCNLTPGFDYEFDNYVKLSKDLTEYVQNPNKPCPTCKTVICADHSTLEQAKQTINSNDTKTKIIIDKYTKDLQNIQLEQDSIKEHLQCLSEELKIEVPTVDTLTKEIESYSIKSSKIGIKILNITNLESEKLQLEAKLNATKGQKLNIEKDLKHKIAEFDYINITLPCVDLYNLEMIVQEKEILNDKLKSLEQLSGEKLLHICRLEKLKSGFKDIKSYVFSSVLNEINARVQVYLDQLFEMPIKLKFTNDNMKISTELTINSNTQILGLASGGQFRRLCLATDLALSDVVSSRKGNNIGILILDEYFKDLSEQSMGKCLELLEIRKQPVLLVEHNSIFKNIVNKSFFVKYENGTSEVKI